MFLLDTSVLSVLPNPQHPQHAKAVAFQAQHAGNEKSLFICVVSLAEMQFGLSLYEGRTPKPHPADLDVVRTRVQAAARLSEPLEVTRHVAVEHGRLRAKWAWAVAPNKAQQRRVKSMPPECWSDDWPASALQITENDIWIAAVALTHDMTLVSCDRDFDKLAEAEPQLRVLRL